MSDITKIQNVSAETKSAITRKSAQTLPNHPSEMGYSAEEIKRRFYQPILDAANSALAEIDRVVNEANRAIGQVDGNLQEYIDSNILTESYKLTLDNTNWVLNTDNNLFEVIIDHEEHGIGNYKEVGVDMFLLDSDNRYIPVNNYEVLPNGDVRCFHESNSIGFVSIYIKREGFIVGAAVTDVNHVVGIAEVAKTNDYDDLDNKPNLEQMASNEQMLSKIVAGTQKIGSASQADNATNADYASSSGSTDHAANSDFAKKAAADEFGVNINNGYCKQTGTYPNVSVGKATNADNAKNDESGNNIKNTYARQDGTYANLKAGKATRADSAASADSATKASKDANGAQIDTTYAKQNGTYSNMTVGKATKADNATNASKAVSADSATKATQDGNGRNIANTYTTGCIIERTTISVQMRVGDRTDGLVDGCDLFRDSATYFDVRVITIRNINSSQKAIITGGVVRQVQVGSNRYDKDYLFLHLPDGYDYPSRVRLTSEEYGSGCVPNNADSSGIVTINGLKFMRYNLFDEGYDFNNGHYISVEFIY